MAKNHVIQAGQLGIAINVSDTCLRLLSIDSDLNCLQARALFGMNPFTFDVQA